MRKSLLGLLSGVLLLLGCASTPKTYRYWYLERAGGVTIKEVNEAYMTEYCKATETDLGEPVTWKTRIIGCYRGDGEILILQGYGCVLLHELCHHEGLPRQVCKEQFDLCN